MRVFELTTTVTAAPASVWAMLIDIEQYDRWNTVVPSGRGAAAVDSQVHLMLKRPNGQLVPFSPMVVAVHPNEELTFGAAVIHRALIHMRHRFIVRAANDNSTDLIQRWECSGVLVPFVWKQLVAGMQPFAQLGVDLQRALR